MFNKELYAETEFHTVDQWGEFTVNDPLGYIYFTYLSCEKKGFN